MAVTIANFSGRYRRYAETGAANTALTVTAPSLNCRVLYAITAYSATPVQAGVDHKIDSGAGAGYDATLNTGTANARYTVYTPTELRLASDDAFLVTAPAGGAAVTASVLIVVELL